MAVCVVLEDTMTGITSAVASRVTILAFTGFNSDDRSSGPQFASFDSYRGVPPSLGEYVQRRRSQQ